MWFATKDGLCRYDGYNFIVYCESLVKESISNSKVRCIAEDAYKNIWVGTDNGLNCINLLSQHILSFFPNELSPLKSILIPPPIYCGLQQIKELHGMIQIPENL